MSQANEENLIWIDLEMTGLDTDADSILEIATIVTDKDLHILAEGPVFAIQHPLERLESMDAWNRNQHRRSGLWDQVVASVDTHEAAEQATLDFLKQWLPTGKSPMFVPWPEMNRSGVRLTVMRSSQRVTDQKPGPFGRPGYSNSS